MSNKFGYKRAWLLLAATVLAAFAVVAIPVWLIQPFAAQTERNLQISFLLKSWSPVLTLLAVLVSIALSVFIWQTSKRWFGKAFLLDGKTLEFFCQARFV